MRKVLLALTALVAVVILTAGAASACDITNGRVGCANGCINLGWDIVLSDQCPLVNVKIERKCGGGSYALLDQGMFTSGYSDCTGAACISGWTYRITVECQCGTNDSIVIGPETCP